MKYNLSIAFFISICLVACVKPNYQLNNLIPPSNLQATVLIQDTTKTSPSGDGTGKISLNLTCDHAITYNVDFGDGTNQIVPTGNVNYKYTNQGTNTYNIVITAIGSGGLITTMSKSVTVKVNFSLPSQFVSYLTNDTSKVWVSASSMAGHIGVGPANSYTADFYSASPNQRDPCEYDDEVKFTKNPDGSFILNIDNKGNSYFIKEAVSFYGFTGGGEFGGCFPLVIPANQILRFGESIPPSIDNVVTTGYQFVVPSPGILNFGTGANTYEVLLLTNNMLSLRSIGVDGLAWYQILQPK
ncbi:MAG: PKD domain-containing protein [Alphaproteobacteria bacterium]|nr:PKD domain-containing protein [Alphaproteobacteria bacterium]